MCHPCREAMSCSRRITSLHGLISFTMAAVQSVTTIAETGGALCRIHPGSCFREFYYT
jgi:hypothetical protein